MNYADDTTPYAVGNTWGEVKEKLISSTEIIFTWLPINQMVGNANKCQLITNQKNNLLSLKIGNDRLVTGPAEALRQNRFWPQDFFSAKICFFLDEEKTFLKRFTNTQIR